MNDNIVIINDSLNKYLFLKYSIECTNIKLWINNFDKDFDLRWKRHYTYYTNK